MAKSRKRLRNDENSNWKLGHFLADLNMFPPLIKLGLFHDKNVFVKVS